MKTTKIKRTLAGLMLLTATTPVMAQQTFSLKQCQEQALQNNIKIKTSNTDIRMAQESKAVARSRYIPTVSGTMTAFDASKDLLTIDMPTIPGLGSLGTMGMINDGQIAGVTAMMPLYAGGQIHNSNKLADLGVEIKKLQLSQNEGEVRYTVAQYYWQVVMLKAKLKTLDFVDAQLAEMHKNVQQAVDAGVSLQNDLLQVNLKQNEISSSRLKLTDALLISRMILAQYMGMGLDSVDVDNFADYAMPSSPQSLYVAPASALGNTAEYRMLQKNVDAQKLQQKITLGKNLPTLSLGGGYNYMNLTDKGRTFWLGFATVSIPISSWLGGTHEVRKQKIAVENAQLSLHDNSEMLQLQMVNKWNKVNESYRQVELALKSIEQSEENLRLQNNQYQAGVRTMSDLLEAETIFQRSRDQFVDSFTTYQVSCAEYLKVTGR